MVKSFLQTFIPLYSEPTGEPYRETAIAFPYAKPNAPTTLNPNALANKTVDSVLPLLRRFRSGAAGLPRSIATSRRL